VYFVGPIGPTANSGLSLQTNGNLVILNGSGATVWSSGTTNNPGDVMLFQPDGNLVIYNNYGKSLWASGTANAPIYN
jgi:hypothetical protein